MYIHEFWIKLFTSNGIPPAIVLALESLLAAATEDLRLDFFFISMTGEGGEGGPRTGSTLSDTDITGSQLSSLEYN